jgi:hypothetical protein
VLDEFLSEVLEGCEEIIPIGQVIMCVGKTIFDRRHKNFTVVKVIL